jgi:hypothetical protein
LTNRSGPEERPNPPGLDAATAQPGVEQPTLPGDETVPVWALVSIGLGLVALTGSVVTVCLVGTAILLGWLVKSTGPDHSVNRDKPEGPYWPYGGVGLWRML